MGHLAFTCDLLPSLFAALGPEGSSGGGELSDSGASNAASGHEGSSSSSLAAGTVLQPTMAQAALLEALCTEAHDMPQAKVAAAAGAEAGAAETAAAGGTSMAFLVQLAQQLVAHSKAAPLSPGQQQVLQEALHLMRDVCARDDSGAGLAGPAAAGAPRDLVTELQAAGFVPALLAMLKALEPIQNPQRQREAAAAAAPAVGSPASSDGASGSAGGIQVAELAPALAGQAAAFPAAPPYTGFRSDLLAAVANAAHGRPAVQVGWLGGALIWIGKTASRSRGPA